MRVFMDKLVSFFSGREKDHAFESVIAPYIDALHRQAHQYTGVEHDAEDLVQELLVELYQKKAKVLAVTNVKAWLFRCLFNRFIDKYRKSKAKPDFEDIYEVENEFYIDSKESPEKDYWHMQVMDGLNKLSHSQRMAIRLHDIEGYTVTEISEIMCMPIGTLKSHIHRGRSAMKKKFANSR